jgi:hypothetical protein
MFNRFSSHFVNLLACGLYLGLALAAWIKHIGWAQHEIWQLLICTAMMTAFFAAAFNYWRYLKIAEAPISTIAGAAQGYIELQGVASTIKPIKTPYHGIPCVWYRAWVYANRPKQKDELDGYSQRLLDYSESQVVFTLNDGTGVCSVDPAGAELIYMQARTEYKNDHRYVEEYLPVGKPIYVLGQLDTRHDILDDAKVNEYLRQKLANWKKQPQQLINRFDQNRDGKIDIEEWELARLEARKQVYAEHEMRKHTGSFTLKKPQNHHLFLISAKSPQLLRDTYMHWLCLHLGVLVSLFFLYLRFN